MIKYDKLIAIFNERKINGYTLKKHKVIGQSAFKKILEGGHIDTRTLDHLCSYLDCQPGDLLEYVPDEAQEGNVPNETE